MVEPKEKQTTFDYEDDFSVKDFTDECIPDDIIFPTTLNEHLRNQIRDLTSENGSLRRTLQEAEQKLLEELSRNKMKSEDGLNNSSKVEEMRILQEKLTQVNSKYSKCQNSCLTLRQELNKAQKLLSREVGETVTVSGLLSQPGGWKGRAEQIHQLQSKISELQHKLNDSEKSSRCSSASLERSIISRAKSMERGKRQQVESLEKELRLADTALESNKKKLEAARARIKVLENEIADSRRNFIILNDSKIHDDQLIDALNGRLRAMEDKYNEKELGYKNQLEKASRERTVLKNELHSSKLLIEQLRRKYSESEAQLDRLRSGTSKVDMNNSKSSQKFHDAPSPLATRRSHQDPDEYVTLGIAAEAERERLIGMVAILNRRLDKERSDADHKSELLRREKDKNFKLENKLQKLENERVIKPRVNSGYRSKSSSSLTSTSKSGMTDDSLKNKLELVEEENLALKARITTIQQEKSEDLATYQQLVENTKKIFHDALRGKITSAAHSTITV